MYRVVKTGGKQFLVHEGMELTVDLMKVKKSDQVKFDCLLKFDDEGKTFELGAPLLKDKV
ncbi:50S ribosomal protein L21, partial [Candidatus Roizmanbacteria bacterium CG_4_8_14_3_um_filter_34_9]